MGGRRLQGIGMAVVSASLLAGCASGTVPHRGSPPATTDPGAASHFTIPVFEKACPRPGAAASTLPIRVLRRPGTDNLEIAVNVCINGSGPYPFLLDTGASESAIDTNLADQLHLKNILGPMTVHSFGCTRKVSYTLASSWGVGDTTLSPRPILVGTLRSPDVPDLDGLIGSDVLSEFGAVRIDYQQQVVVLGSRGSPLFTSVPGHSAPVSLPASLAKGASFAAPMNVTVSQQPVPGVEDQMISIVRPTVEFTIGSKQFDFAVDTGAETLIIAPTVTSALALEPTGQPETIDAGLDCPITSTPYRMPAGSLGDVQVPSQPVLGNVIGGYDGLFGSGELAKFNPVVIDYTDGELLLGPGS